VSTLNAKPVGYIPPSPPSKLGYVTVRSSDGRFTLTALLGQNLPQLSDGQGGWVEVARDRRPAVIEWDGPAAAKCVLEVLLDGWASGASLAGQLAAVAGLCPLSPVGETPVMYVSGCPLIPVTVPWVCQSAVPSDWLLTSSGAVARVTYTLSLLQYRLGESVVRNSPGKAAASKSGTVSKAKVKTYVVKRGDTLPALAARFLGSSSKWRTLAAAQKPALRDPNHLKAGQKLTIP
jgi:hypothetical protein